MTRVIPAPLLKALPIILPLAAIGLARLLTYSAWAAANAGWAALLFAWVVADALLLALTAKAPKHKPETFQILGCLSLASIIIIIGAAAPVRDVYLSMPSVMIAGGATLALFAGWSSLRVARAARATGSIAEALEEVLPARMVRPAIKEARMLHLALLRWGAPADVPVGSRSFAYHTYLTPMLITIVVLQVIELSVVHFLLMLWSPTVAWVLFALSVWGVVWTLALIKSFRIYPVLVTGDHVRVRSGMIHDFAVPLSAIADVKRAFTSEELEAKSVLNLAILSAPNISLRLAQPITIPSFFGGEREITGVALRLDDSAAFLAELKRQD